MNYILMGCPGSGKGTFCEQMREQGYSIIALGQKLRDEVKRGTELGKAIQINVDKGILIPDQLAFDLVRPDIESNFLKKKFFIIEGFPSTIAQYALLTSYLKEKEMLPETRLIYLDCTPEVAIERIINRLTCKNCERIYNRVFKPPKLIGQCDACNSPLYSRPEDTRETAAARIKAFFEKTYPILELATSLRSSLS